MAIVSIRDLTKSYGRRPPALRDVTFDVADGITGLLGPNGAGKSTLIQCVLGLLPDYTGTVEVLGLDTRRRGREIRRRVGFMPETDAYLHAMTGIRAVRYLGQLTGMPYNDALRRAHEVLFHVGLGEAVYRDIRQYSTGMRQRFKLAQALVHDPEVLFLDEPLAGLDPSGRDELLDLIRDLATDHGKHVIWSSHILPEVQKVAQNIVVLQDGRCRGTFALEELLPHESIFSVEAEGETQQFRSTLVAHGIDVVEGRGPQEEEGVELGTTARRFTVTLPADDGVAAVFKLARESGARVRSIAPLTEGLEEVFLRIVGREETD